VIHNTPLDPNDKRIPNLPYSKNCVYAFDGYAWRLESVKVVSKYPDIFIKWSDEPTKPE
jgi:hypothetical protein